MAGYYLAQKCRGNLPQFSSSETVASGSKSFPEQNISPLHAQRLDFVPMISVPSATYMNGWWDEEPLPLINTFNKMPM